jgi:hypothetical protein
MRRATFAVLVIFAAACGGRRLDSVYAFPDTAAMVARLNREHPGATLREAEVTRVPIVWHSGRRPADSFEGRTGTAWILMLTGDSTVGLVLFGQGTEAPKEVYSSGLMEAFDGCGALQFGIEGVSAHTFRHRPLLVVKEGRMRSSDCVDDNLSDTTWLRFLDVSHGYREVLSLATEVRFRTIRSIPCPAECWETDTLAMRYTYWNGEDDRGLGFDVLGVGPGEHEFKVVYDWNADSTKLVVKSRYPAN